MRRRHRFLALAALVACLFAPAGGLVPVAEAQLPRIHDSSGIGPRKLRDFLDTGRFQRVVTVDAGGQGDFTTVALAIAYVSAQNHDASHPWTIISWSLVNTTDIGDLPANTQLIAWGVESLSGAFVLSANTIALSPRDSFSVSTGEDGVISLSSETTADIASSLGGQLTIDAGVALTGDTITLSPRDSFTVSTGEDGVIALSSETTADIASSLGGQLTLDADVALTGANLAWLNCAAAGCKVQLDAKAGVEITSIATLPTCDGTVPKRLFTKNDGSLCYCDGSSYTKLAGTACP